MSAFDPDVFLNQTIDEANDTQYQTLPPGEYTAVVEKVEVPTGRMNKDGDPIHMLNITWDIMDDRVKAELGREKVVVFQTIFLDITEDGALDMGKGKNVPLGKLREAMGMNSAGFRLADIIGRPAVVNVSRDPDKQDPTILRNRVKSVGKME